MKNIAKTALIAFALLIVPVKQWAQTVRNNVVEIELSGIANPDYRYCLFSTIAQDDNVSYVINEENSSVLLSSVHEWPDDQFQSYYDELKSNTMAQFDQYLLAEKEIQGTLFTSWKESLPQELFVLLFRQMLIENPTNRDGNQTCANSDPFCTTDVVTFHVDASASGVCESGPNYGCMSSYTSRPPFWFHMKIAVAGTFTIQITNSNGLDLDFCAWGPFTDPTTPCPDQLTSDKIIDCDSPWNTLQECTVPGSSQVGQYYIMVITKYSSGSTDITFQKVANSGPGETDCGILPGIASNDGPYCAGQTIQLHVNAQAGATYSWTGPGGWTSTQQNPTRPNCTTAMSGTYTCVTTVGTQTTTASTQVVVNAQPVANAGPDQTIIYGATAQLSGAGGAGTFNYQWTPANMVVNPNQQNTQTVSLTSDQTYTLTVTNPQGGCTSTDQVTIHISGSNMVVTPGDDMSICQGGSAMIQANAGGGTGNFTYSWSPTTGLSNPTASNPIASPSQTTTYTCTVSDGMSTQSVSVTVTVNDIVITHEYVSVCPNQPYTWHGTTYTTAGVFEYNTTTAQGCEETDYLHLDYYPTYDETSVYAAICQGETYYYYGNDYTETGQYPITLQTIHGCDSIVRLNLTVWPENELTENRVSVCPELLPYVFYGENYYGNVDVTVWDTDIHGCDSAVRLILTVNDYYQPEIQNEYVCYTGAPSYDWNPIGNYHFTLTESGYYTDTLPTSACEGIFRLNLQFMPVPEEEYTEVVQCDSYRWPQTNQVYTQSGDYYDHVSLAPFPCEQVYHLHLTINKSDITAHKEFDNECNEVSFDWFGETHTFTTNGVYHFNTGQTTHGCDTAMVVTVTNMRYTPQPFIKCSDESIEFPDHPITATEFSVNRYTYHVEDAVSDISTWFFDQCEWTISKSSWPIVISEDKLSCTVYAMDWVPDTIWLEFKAVNKCSTKVARYGLVPSFYGVEEQESYPASVSVIPNPNDGQMELRFSNMEGKINVKVFNAAGLVVDNFELHTTQTPDSYYYSMKRLPNGVYCFVFSDGKRTTTSKVVIIH